MKSPGKSKKEHKPSLQHVRLHHWMMNTAAWQSLDAIEQSFYMQIARRYNGTNNGRIAFGCRDAEKALKVGRRTALRARADPSRSRLHRCDQDRRIQLEGSPLDRMAADRVPLRRDRRARDDGLHALAATGHTPASTEHGKKLWIDYMCPRTAPSQSPHSTYRGPTVPPQHLCCPPTAPISPPTAPMF